MVNDNMSLWEAAKPAFFSVRPILFFLVFGLQDQDLDPQMALQKLETARCPESLKKQDCEIH